MRLSQRVVLVALVIAGVGTVTPLLLDYGAALWWIALPALAAWLAFVWLRGWRWVAGDDADQAPTLGYRLACCAAVLFWSFIALVTAIFLGMLAAAYWVWIVAALVVLALFVGWALAADWLDQRRKARDLAAPSPPAAPDDIVT